MESVIATIDAAVAAAVSLHAAVWASLALAVLLVAALVAWIRLRQRFGDLEAILLEKSIAIHSRNWTATAINLEKKAREPGDVARSSAMTFLHLLDEAAEAWRKGSQWPEALRVTQQLLVQTCHAIGSPGFGENQFRACADLIENKLSIYADLSKAASEAPENAERFLQQLDLLLSIHQQPARILQIRDMLVEVWSAITQEQHSHATGAAHGRKLAS